MQLLKFYSHLVTHELAMQWTHGRRGLVPLQLLSDELVWGTAGMKHATTWQHVDDEGFGTVVTNMVGCKYWVLARRRRDSPVAEWHGDMSCTVSFRDTIRPIAACSDMWEHEGLLLTPGTVL